MISERSSEKCLSSFPSGMRAQGHRALEFGVTDAVYVGKVHAQGPNHFAQQSSVQVLQTLRPFCLGYLIAAAA